MLTACPCFDKLTMTRGGGRPLPFVTLSVSKGEASSDPMLRQAQHDRADFVARKAWQERFAAPAELAA
jgi:hypothetical protein